jgi:hypothetical protein
MRLADEEDGVKEAPLRIKDDVSVSPEPPCGLEVGIAVCPIVNLRDCVQKASPKYQADEQCRNAQQKYLPEWHS